DAMEGPTPVSALVHSATMVAAGVYLTARFTPMFLPEVLLVIAYIGCITLFLGATIAIVATDIKRVLAYSTISQLGYMMLGLGLAGWGAGLYHLFTHAFFKSLMFLCAGSVIVGCHHVQEMPRMGGLLKKMPITAITMLIGVIAICGLSIPGLKIPWVGALSFSGYHSKDAIVATSLAYSNLNPVHLLLFVIPLITAGITAFYMFRLWFYTFWGEPRDKELYSHVHESPWVMTGPLIVLAIFAAFSAVGGEDNGPLFKTIDGSRPAHIGIFLEDQGIAGTRITLPGHDEIHDVHGQAGVYALIVAFAGAILAYIVYGAKLVNPAEIKKQFAGVHNFLVEKWQFDELYDALFVLPARTVGGWIVAIDRTVLDGLLHWLANVCVKISRWDRWFDEHAVDGLVNILGEKTYSIGTWVRGAQTGNLRDYVLSILIAVGALAVLVPIIALLS
ncbi:MAG: NADH-quinone oxidoreductase subunit L, partial [Planctomycetaceae bacterium]|nr:NADH-quinone oxidoreductase subunit L [Planctomycetaceae bacterium]